MEIEGQQYRALPADTVRTILKTKQERDLFEQKYNELFNKYLDFQKGSDVALKAQYDRDKVEVDKASNLAKFWQSEYNSELKLRNSLTNKVSRCSGRILVVRLCFF